MNINLFFKSSWIVVLLMLTGLPVWSQYGPFGFGFRAGLSYAVIDGPSEIGPGGEELQKSRMTNGFHIGALMNVKFTDLAGLHVELLYSQRGSERTYDGPSYYVLGKNTLQSLTIMGTRKQSVSVSNAYLDIPVTAYYKIGHFEVTGGLHAGILMASTGGGNIQFNYNSAFGETVFDLNLNYNYKRDEAGEASAQTQQVNVDGRNYELPTALGAYYDFESRGKMYYKTLDFGLVGGISYFLNDNLFLSVRYIHGLGDIDRNEYDISFQSLQGNGAYVQREDKNTSKSWQFSIGFSF
jgi:hypothetical protein